MFIIIGLWLEWIQDELPLASVPNGLQEIQSLFDQAVEDYMCKLFVRITINTCSSISIIIITIKLLTYGLNTAILLLIK